jgi:hypothetical protein
MARGKTQIISINLLSILTYIYIKGCKKKTFSTTKMAITQSISTAHVTPITGSEILSGFQIILQNHGA